MWQTYSYHIGSYIEISETSKGILLITNVEGGITNWSSTRVSPFNTAINNQIQERSCNAINL